MLASQDSSVGDVFGIMLLMPLLLSFVAIAIPMAILAAPVMVLYSLALPIVLILTAYVTGSFLALLCSGITAAAWAGLVASYRRILAQLPGQLDDLDASGGFPTVCRILLASKSFTEVAAKTARGWTPLQLAAAHGLEEVCDVLLEHP
eukprot:g23575.t1